MHYYNNANKPLLQQIKNQGKVYLKKKPENSLTATV